MLGKVPHSMMKLILSVRSQFDEVAELLFWHGDSGGQCTVINALWWKWHILLNLWEDDEGDHSDEQEQEDYNAIDVDGLGEDQLDDSDKDEAIWNIKQLHKT